MVWDFESAPALEHRAYRSPTPFGDCHGWYWGQADDSGVDAGAAFARLSGERCEADKLAANLEAGAKPHQLNRFRQLKSRPRRRFRGCPHNSNEFRDRSPPPLRSCDYRRPRIGSDLHLTRKSSLHDGPIKSLPCPAMPSFAVRLLLVVLLLFRSLLFVLRFCRCQHARRRSRVELCQHFSG